MNNSICRDRSRKILKEYAENIGIARLLAGEQNIRAEFLCLLDVMENMRQNWNAEKSRADALQEKINTKEYDYSELRQENRVYKEQLRDARAQIATLMSDKQNLERDMAEMERKFALVGELLKNDQSLLKEEDRQKLAFLNDKSIFQKPIPIQQQANHINRAGGISRTLSHGDEIDYDKTGDSMEISYDDSDESHLRSGKAYRRSKSLVAVSSTRPSVVNVKRPKESKRMDMVEEEMVTPCKRSKDESETIITTTTTITLDTEGKRPPTANISIRRSMNRSMSESNILNQKEEGATNSVAKFNALTPRYGASALDLKMACTSVVTLETSSKSMSTSKTARFCHDTFISSFCATAIGCRSPHSAVKTWTNGASIETRPHTFVNFTSILGDRCEVCNRWIQLAGKPACKCTDCGIRLHKSCTEDAPIPCVPRTPTPRTPGKQRPRLKDFCPSTQPMIPPLIIHCVLALDKDRLNTEGIYRIPGQESQIVKLLGEFKNGRSLPKLEYQDTETITGCIKRFLREIRDPVIPASSWDEFVNAAEAEDLEALNHSVLDLPYPNRDTLAFLCAHFQKVCDNSIRNKMSPEILARCIAPTIVGRAPPRAMNMAQNSDEVSKQIMVLLTLLRMPRDYWPKFYAFDQGKPLITTPTSRTTTAASINNQEIKTPFRPLVQMSSNTGRRDPNRSMLGPIDTPPTGQRPREFQPLSSKRNRFFADLH